MKKPLLLPIAGLLMLASCRKDEPYRQNCHIVGVKTAQSLNQLTYNRDGSMRSLGAQVLTHFNNRTLSEVLAFDDTSTLDDQGRLFSLQMAWNGTQRQVRSFEYDAQNRITRTHTNTGNGLDYLVDIAWENGDAVRMGYNIGSAPTQGTADYHYAFYDIPTSEPYLAYRPFGQVGIIYNTHLLKHIAFRQDTTYLRYRFDSANRVTTMYRERTTGNPSSPRYSDSSTFFYDCN